MRLGLSTVLILAMLCAQTWAEGNSFKKIRYTGGTISAKVNQFDWNTTLTITPDAILLDFGRRQTARIAVADVTALSYGREAHRRVADVVTLSFFLTPVALFGLLHESKQHLIGVEYKTSEGKVGCVLLEADKVSYRLILQLLKTVTQKPVAGDPT